MEKCMLSEAELVALAKMVANGKGYEAIQEALRLQRERIVAELTKEAIDHKIHEAHDIHDALMDFALRLEATR